MIKRIKAVSILVLLVGITTSQATQAQSDLRSSATRPRRAFDEARLVSGDDKPLKLSADLVTVLATVSDAAGSMVSDLSKEDFQVFEDEKPQEVSDFLRENQTQLRLVFLFDASSSIKSRFDFEKRAASLFFRQVLRPGDEAAIFSVGSDPKLELGFTPDPSTIDATLDQVKPGGATALYGATLEAAKYLKGTPGRHVILVLSDGEDTSSSNSLVRALTEVQRSDSIIYCVHSMGVSASPNSQAQSGENVLKSMSDETGGLAFFPTVSSDRKKEVRELDDIYSRIAKDIRGQYLLTYYSNGGSNDRRYRAIRLQLKRPGLNVRARRGYYTADE